MAGSRRWAFRGRFAKRYERIDAGGKACRSPEQPPTFLFNHSFTLGKRPQQFLHLAFGLMKDVPELSVHMTRVPAEQIISGNCPHRLFGEFHDRVHVHHGPSIQDYFELLWKTDFQLSVASYETWGIATLEAIYAANCCLTPNRVAYKEMLPLTPETRFKDDSGHTVCLSLITDPERARRAEMDQGKVTTAVASPDVVAQRIVQSFNANDAADSGWADIVAPGFPDSTVGPFHADLPTPVRGGGAWY